MIRRTTRQLAAVLAAVRAEREHPTAQAIYQHVRRKMPAISRGTVYRNLSKLEREAQVRSLRLADGPVLYDGVVEDHDHFVCERCGKIRDLKPPEGRQPRELREDGYVVSRQTVMYYGVCPTCTATR